MDWPPGAITTIKQRIGPVGAHAKPLVADALNWTAADFRSEAALLSPLNVINFASS
ncbi:MAG: hypothetical protein ING62_00060 [Rhodocyclaceae bacterium]|nr:hypothetical protein [Rhodocyclaceae bacterium]